MHKRSISRRTYAHRETRRISPEAWRRSFRGCGSWCAPKREQLLLGRAEREQRHALNGVEGRHRQGQMRLGLRAPGSRRLFDQGLIEAAFSLEQCAEGRAVGQQRTKGDVLLLLLVGSECRVGLGDVGEERRVLCLGRLRCPQRCRVRRRRLWRSRGVSGRGRPDQATAAPSTTTNRKSARRAVADAPQWRCHCRHVVSVTHACLARLEAP